MDQITTLKKRLGEKEKILFFDLAETFVSSLIVLTVLFSLLAFPEVVSGASMEPILYSGERILVERLTKRFADFKRGDIVVFYPPGNDEDHYVKRIVGVPGDIVKIYECEVYITRNGQKLKLSEGYLDDGLCTSGGSQVKEGQAVRIEEGKYLLLGDNRERSQDSRIFGLVDEERIVGKVVFKFWPIGHFGFL